MALTNPDGLPPTPNPEGVTKLDRLTPPQPEGLETQKILKEGTEQLQKSSKTSDASGGIAAMAMIVAALFMWRQERAESRKKRFETAPDPGGFDARTVENPAAELKTMEERIATIDTEFKQNQDDEAALKPRFLPPIDLPSGGSIQKKLESDAQTTIKGLQEQRTALTKERAQMQARVTMIKMEMDRRIGMVQGLQKSLGPTSVASSATLESGRSLRITLRNPLSKNDRDELEKTLTALRAGSGTTSLDGTSITIALPPEFFAPRFPVTPGSMGAAGLSARQNIFAWLSGTSIEEIDQKTKKSEATGKTDEAEKTQKEKKTADDLEAKAAKETVMKDQGNKDGTAKDLKEKTAAEVSEKLESVQRELLFNMTLENLHAEPLVNNSTGEGVYRVTDIVGNQQVSIYFRLHRTPGNPLGVVQMATALPQFQNLIPKHGLPTEFNGIVMQLLAFQGLSGESLTKNIEAQELHAERMQRGVEYAVNVMGGVLLRNSRNEVVVAVPSRSEGSQPAMTQNFYRYDTALGQWRTIATIDARPGTPASSGGLGRYNGDWQAIRKAATEDALHIQKKQLGEAQLYAEGARPFPGHPGVFMFVAGNYAVYFNYTTHSGWTWAVHPLGNDVPGPVGSYSRRREWGPLTRLYTNTTDVNLLACNRLAGLLQAINTGTAVSLNTPAMQTMLDRQTRIRAGNDFLLNVCGVPNRDDSEYFFALHRGPITAYVYLAGPEPKTWRWSESSSIAHERQPGNPLSTLFDTATGTDLAEKTEMNQILTQLHGLQTGSTTHIQSFAREQRQIREAEPLIDRMHLANMYDFIHMLGRRGVRFEIPILFNSNLGADHVADAGYTDADGNFILRNRGIVGFRTAAQAAHMILSALSADTHAGILVNESGQILQAAGNVVLWPVPPQTGNWATLLRSDGTAALRTLCSIPLNTVTDKRCGETIGMIRDLCGTMALSTRPGIIAAAPAREQMINRQRQRTRGLQEMVAHLYISTARELQDRYRGNVLRGDDLLYNRSYSPTQVIVGGLGGQIRERNTQYEEAREFQNRCVIAYRQLRNEWPQNASPENQIAFLMRLRTLTNDQSALAEAGKRTTEILQKFDKVIVGVQVVDSALEMAAGYVPWGTEVYYGAKTVGSLAGSVDGGPGGQSVADVIQKNAVGYGSAKLSTLGGPMLRRAGGMLGSREMIEGGANEFINTLRGGGALDEAALKGLQGSGKAAQDKIKKGTDMLEKTKTAYDENQKKLNTPS